MGKRILSLVLALCLLLALVPQTSLTAAAYSDTDIAYAVEGGNIYFDKETGKITDCDHSVTAANIPAEIDGVAVTGIGYEAFYYCTSLTSVTIPDSVTSIGESAFGSCEKLTKLTLPDSVTSIGDSAFSSCTKLTSINIPSGVTTINSDTFHLCYSLTGITIPEGVTSIGDYAFSRCEKLTSIIIPEGVTSIGDSAFSYCEKLTSINIPASVTSIGSYAFHGCDRLTGIWVSEENPNYSSDECGVLFNKDKTDLIQAPGALKGDYTIPNGVTNIKRSAYYDCRQLTSVIIPDSVTFIGWEAFTYCTRLTSVTIGDSVTTIGGSAFYGCENLTSVIIPDSVNCINERAFYLCKRLTSITIGSGVSSIELEALYGCHSLTGIWVSENNTTYCSDERGVLFNKNKTYLKQVPGALEGDYFIPESVTSFSYLAFRGCSRLTSINNIPDGITTIFSDEFSGCSSLLSIMIPDSVTAIYNYAFEDCSSLTDVYYSGSEEQWAAISIGSNNEHLTNATIHFNSTGPVFPSTSAEGTVEYFCKWDAENQIAYFGLSPEENTANLGYQVTEDTDTSFLENVNELVGTYVLAQTRIRDDGMLLPDTLLRIEPLESRMGIVTRADNETITIDNVTWSVPTDLIQPDKYTGERVLYHIYQGGLLRVSLLRKETGMLSVWNAETRKLTITTDGLTGSTSHFTLSPLADQETLALLGDSCSMHAHVSFTLDSANLVYHLELLPEEPEEKELYDPKIHAWSFRNNTDGFRYTDIEQETGVSYRIPDERYKSVFGATYVASARASSSEVFSSMMPEWGGNCFGMSVTSLLFYFGRLKLRDYQIDNQTVNDYYSEVRKRWEDAPVGYKSCVYTTAGQSITELIESYQILQKGTSPCIETDIVPSDQDFEYLVNSDDGVEHWAHNPNGTYISTILDAIMQSDEPLLLSLQSYRGGHAVVTRTDKKPEKMADGTYRVYIYDPNHPYLPQNVISASSRDPASYYSNGTDLYIEFKPDQGDNKWRYYGSVNGNTAASYWGCDENWEPIVGSRESVEYPDYIARRKPVHNAGYPLSFSGSEPWLPKYEGKEGFSRVWIIASANIYDADGDLLCSTKDGVPVYCADGVTYSPCVGIVEDGTSAPTGCLTIPSTELAIEYLDGKDMSIISAENVFNIAATGDVKLKLSTSEGKLCVEGVDSSDVLVQITDVYSSSEYTSVVADGTLNEGDSFTLKLKEDVCSAVVSGDATIDLYTDDDEQPENRKIRSLEESDGEIHIDDVRKEEAIAHSHRYTDIVTAPTCTERGYTTHTCECGDSYVDTYVDALGHDFVVNTCSRCGAKGQGKDFSDVSDESWFYDYVVAATNLGLVNGYEDNTFRPFGNLTRAEAVTLLYRAAGSPAVTGRATFTDLDGQWYQDAICWAQQNKVVNGISATEFAPNTPITREAFLTMIWRYAGSPAAGGSLSIFADTATVDSWAVTAFAWAVEKGIINGTTLPGKTGLHLAPLNNITRAEAAKVLVVYTSL